MVGWFVGLTVLGLVAGFFAYVYHTAKRKGTFEPKAYYQTSINDATGLKVGDPVKLMGFDVGEITAVIPNSPNDYYNVTIEFFVRQGGENRYFDYILTDSSAQIASADLLGNRFVEIIKGRWGVKTVWQPDRQNAKLRRLHQMRPVQEDKVKLKAWESQTYAAELVRYAKWDTLRKTLEADMQNAGVDVAAWRLWSQPDASFQDASPDAVNAAWKKFVVYNNKDEAEAEPKPWIGFLADALPLAELETVYPDLAGLPGDYTDPEAPKPYYLDSAESEALGDVVTKVADQINNVVGKKGAIGDLVINDDIRGLFKKLDDKGFVADLVMNEEMAGIVSNLTQVTSNFVTLSDNLAGKRGAVTDLFMTDDLRLTVEEATVTLAHVNELLAKVDVAWSNGPASPTA